MEIDISTTIIGGIFTIAIFGPFAFLVLKEMNRTKRIQRIIRQVEKETNSKFMNSEIWNDRAIGIDHETRRLIFVDKLFQTQPWKLLELNKATNCHIVDTGDIIQIIIEGNNEHGPDVLTIYNTKTDEPLKRGFHTVLAKKWVQLIEKELPKKSKSTLRAA